MEQNNVVPLVLQNGSGNALARERNYSRQLREYVNQIISRLHHFERVSHAQTEKLRQAELAVRDTNGKLTDANAELVRTRQEMEKYRQQWPEISARDRQAQRVLADWEQHEARTNELQIQRRDLQEKLAYEKAVREGAEHQLELDRHALREALVKLHASEARFNGISRELEARNAVAEQAQRAHAVELKQIRAAAEAAAAATVEQTFHHWREKLNQGFSQEMARLRETHAHEIAQLRRAAQASAASELEGLRQKLHQEAQAQLVAERARYVQSLRADTDERSAAVESIKQEVKQRTAELTECRRELASVEEARRRAELQLVQVRERALAESTKQVKAAAEDRARVKELEAAIAVRDEKIAAGEMKASVLAGQIQALKGECALAHELLIQEKNQLRALVDCLMDQWEAEGSLLQGAVDGEWLDALRASTLVTSVTATAVEGAKPAESALSTSASSASPAVSATTTKSPLARPPKRPEKFSRDSKLNC